MTIFKDTAAYLTLLLYIFFNFSQR